jgi:hypothetical protein
MSTKSYSSFVVVLEWDWDCRTNLLITEPAPGGEPLWSVSGHPCNLRLNTTPAETCENKRLPGTTQSVATRWVIRGSRLLRTCLGISGAEEKYSEIPSDALKRLPSKVLGGTTSIRGSTLSRTRTKTSTIFDLRDLDFPPLVYRISNSLDHFHVLQAFIETGLG